MSETQSPSPPAPERPRLAAIVFTDVVGYSARMQRDEAGTLALVKADFALMRERCTQHGGELLNSMGDGLLLCFGSAVQAVACALQIQGEFGARRATLPPEQALEHRIGVHIGDVFRQEAGGVAGDGVNIAARLEAKAPIGGVCISQTVHDTVKGKVPMQAVFIGPEMFKNISEAIPIWHISAADGPMPASSATSFATQLKSQRRQVVAIAAVVVVLIAGGFWLRSQGGRAQVVDTARTASPPKSEAQKLADQARTLFMDSLGNPSNLGGVVSVAERAITLDSTNADALAVASQLDTHLLLMDDTPARRERARNRQELAVNLAPQAVESRVALAWFLVLGLGPPQSNRAEKDLLVLRERLPTDWRLCWIHCILRLQQGRNEEAAEVLEDGAQKIPTWAAIALSQKAVFVRELGRYQEAIQISDRSLAGAAPPNSHAFKAGMELAWRGDLDGALAIAKKMPVEDQIADMGMATFERVFRWRREPGHVLKHLSQDPREWIGWDVGGPKAALKGEAYKALGQPESAQAEWQLALKQINEKLAVTPNDRELLEWKAYLLAELGAPEASALWKRALGLPLAREREMYHFEKIQRLGTDDEIMAELERRAERPLVPVANAVYPFIAAADLRINPAWDRVRELPRFKALVAKLEKDPRFSPTAAAPGK